MGGEKMKNQEFFGLYCGYSQEDIKEIVEDIHKRGTTALMDNYTIREMKGKYVMEDKWEVEPPKILNGGIEKIVIDALSLEFTNKKSNFQNLKELTDYMVSEEEQDMEEYLRNEEEWEY